MPTINFLAVIWIIPNFIRSFCLQFISSNMHYYGDIDPRDVIKQTPSLFSPPPSSSTFSFRFGAAPPAPMASCFPFLPRGPCTWPLLFLVATQVLNPWWLFPFQLFCFNFGSTHAIHHFVVKEPFYVRHLTSKTAHKVMREVGYRFNDIGTFRRTNRWRISQDA